MKKVFYKKPLLLMLLVSLCCYQAYSAVKLPALVSNNMVLQRDVKLRIWGWANPGESVQISFNGKVYKTTTLLDSTWAVQLAAMRKGGPYDMVIKGENEITIKNILMGDVFICSGQSNMEFTVNDFYAADIASSANPNIRQFKVERQASTTVLKDVVKTSGWKEAMPSTVKQFTSVGYFFARDLYAKTGVPIGLINTSYGSALAEAWTSREGLADFPDFLVATHKPISQSTPMALYNAMLAPLTNYAIKGILWYQGEFNKGRAYQYRSLFPALIKDWRSKFKQGDVPFLFVQLPNYDPETAVPKESATAELREAQAMALSMPKTAMAVTIETNSTAILHPLEKKPIGIRLSLAAQKLIYGKKIVASGPMYLSSTVKGNKVIVKFKEIGGGLTAKNGALKQFTIAGADKKFVFATANIVGNTVEVSSPDVAAPVAVRYAWADNPRGANLYNKEELPAAPFRTDDWPGVTVPKNK